MTRVEATKETTLCLPLKPGPRPEILLGRKKAGFGQGKYVGLGGKIEAGETIEEAAVRELAEEVGIRASPANLREMAHLTFLFPARPEWDLVVHVFLLERWQGEPAESAEIAPAWFPLAEIPYPQMWPDARHWLPQVLQGKRVRARFTYRDDNETLATVEA